MVEKETKKVDNLVVNQDEGFVNIFVNPKIYPLDVVHSAAYVFMHKASIVIDGDPEKEIIVKLRPKEDIDNLEGFGRSFNDELLNYAVYKYQSEKNKIIKEAIVQRALFTNQGEGTSEDLTETPSEDDSYSEDPLGIGKPWEETHKEE